MKTKMLMFCDLNCKHASWPEKLTDGSNTCRTFIGLWCSLHKRIVQKNLPCQEKINKTEEQNEITDIFTH